MERDLPSFDAFKRSASYIPTSSPYAFSNATLRVPQHYFCLASTKCSPLGHACLSTSLLSLHERETGNGFAERGELVGAARQGLEDGEVARSEFAGEGSLASRLGLPGRLQAHPSGQASADEQVAMGGRIGLLRSAANNVMRMGFRGCPPSVES